MRFSGRDGKRFGALAAALALAIFFLAMTLRSRRHVEYFVPFAVLAESLWLALFLRRPSFRRLADDLGGRRRFGRTAFALAAACVAVFFIAASVRGVIVVRNSYAYKGIPWSKYQSAAAWLAANTPAGSVIFHSDWDDFPLLFLRDDRNSYICGLDPTFLYRRDPLRHAQWVDITTGRRRTAVVDVITGSFGSRYVLIEKDHEPMNEAVARDSRARLVYDDEEAWIYELSVP